MSLLLRQLRLTSRTARCFTTTNINQSTIQSTARFFSTTNINQSDNQSAESTTSEPPQPTQSNNDQPIEQSDNQSQPEPTRRYAFTPAGSNTTSAFERIDQSGQAEQPAQMSTEQWLNERDRRNAILTGTENPFVFSPTIDACINPYFDESVNYAPLLDPLNVRPMSLKQLTEALSKQPIKESTTSEYPCELLPIYSTGVLGHPDIALPDPSERTPVQRGLKAFTYVIMAAATIYVLLFMEYTKDGQSISSPDALNPTRVSDRPTVVTPLREWTHKHLGIGNVRRNNQTTPQTTPPDASKL